MKAFPLGFFLTITLLATMSACEPPILENDTLLESILQQDGRFDDLLSKKEEYEIQIIYTQVNRDANNRPTFKSFYFNADKERYFYPASSIKMPAAFLALEKLNELGIEGLNKHTAILTDSAYSGQTKAHTDSTSASGLPSIAHYIKKIFLVSDNDAHNRLYEWMGQEAINRKLWEKSYDLRLTHRLSIALSPEENRHTNPIRFEKDGRLVYQQPARQSLLNLHAPSPILKGNGYLSGEEIIREPFDFTLKNSVTLEDLQRMLRAVIFPEATPYQERFHLSQEDYRFLYQYMSQLPSETTYPAYDTAAYPDSYVKFLLFGKSKAPLPKHIRIFNKVGNAYGYLIDNAYIVDFENGIEFFLSAVIHVNQNKIYNDGTYEYDEIGYPFMHHLGEAVYQYERKRKRPFTPDLSKFRVKYDTDTILNFHEGEWDIPLEQGYGKYHQKSLDFRRIKHEDIQPRLAALREHPSFEVQVVGQSAQGRDISLVKYGHGPEKILLWSQMHGNESTATRALFEIFNFLQQNDEFDALRQMLSEKLTLYFVPMLNPDGAEVYKRRTALEIDMNRDALAQQCPESVILKHLRDSLNPTFGFNLHDQGRNYNTSPTDKPASISFLAPAYNEEKEVNQTRGNAMKVIASMNRMLQRHIPGQVAKYDDTFEPRAFGDNIQKWGTGAILIESGGYLHDREKRTLVKMNFLAIIHALKEIATNGYQNESLESYYAIPDNGGRMFDLIIRQATVELEGQKVVMDIAINQEEKEYPLAKEGYYLHGRIQDMGDLSTYFGYQEINARGLTLTPGKLEGTFTPAMGQADCLLLLRQGITAVHSRLPHDFIPHDLPIHRVVYPNRYLPEIAMGAPADLVLQKNGEVYYTVLNGFIFDWKNHQYYFKNALSY
jgi:hypothetical protein